MPEEGSPGPLNGITVDPQVLARRMVVTFDDSALPGLRVAGNPIKLSGVADPVVRPGAPALDADRDAILAELAQRREAHGSKR